MGLLDRFRGPKPGTTWNGPAAWTDDYHLVDRPGFYALTDDGKSIRKPLVRLVGVNLNPSDPDDVSWVLRVASKTDPAQLDAPTGRVVDLESVTNGESGVSG
jgi:hypothetical protein